MPVRFRVFDDLEFTYTRMFRVLTVDEIYDALARYRRSPDHRVGRRALTNFDGVTRFEFSLGDVPEVVTTVNANPSGHTESILLATDDFAFGIARQYQTYASMEGGVRVTVCRSEAEALSALGVNYKTIDALLAAHPAEER